MKNIDKIFKLLICLIFLISIGCNLNGTSTNNPPSSPSISNAVSTDGKITIAWNSVSGAETYNLYYAEGKIIKKFDINKININSPYVLTGLKSNTQYALALSAVNSAGESALGAVVLCVTLPSPPSNVRATVETNQIELNWDTTTGMKYNIYYAEGNKVAKTDAIALSYYRSNVFPPYKITDLKNGILYAFAVTAKGDADESKLSLFVLAYPGESSLFPPQNLTAEIGDSEIEVSFSNVGNATFYNLYYSKGDTVNKNGYDSIISKVFSPYIVTGLTNGDKYAIAVTSANETEESGLSRILLATPVATLLSPPENVMAMITGDDQIEVFWDKVAGADLYYLYYTVDNKETKLPIIDGITHYKITGLINGKQYAIGITAVNKNGESSLSKIVLETLISVFLPGPVAIVASSDNDNAIISWESISSAERYNLYWSNNSGVSISTGNKISDVSNPYFHKIFDKSKNYYYVVTAEYPFFGESSQSDEVCVSFNTPPNKSSNPSPIDGATKVSNSLIFSWSGSDPDSGDTVKYDVYFDTINGTNRVRTDLTEASFNTTGLLYGQTYYWKIVAKDNYASTQSDVWHFATSELPLNRLRLWLNTGIGITKDNENLTSEWADLTSGNVFSVKQTKTVKQPRLTTTPDGFNVIRFDGVNDYLETETLINLLEGKGQYSFFIVTKPGETQKENADIIDYSHDSYVNMSLQQNVNNTNQFGIDNNNYSVWQQFSRRNNLQVFTGIVKQDFSAVSFLNGKNEMTSTTGSLTFFEPNYFTVGNKSQINPLDRQFNGDIAEIIIYDTALISSERISVEKYLIAKYNIDTTNTLNAPSNPSPANGAWWVPKSPTLTWSGGDSNLDEYDTVKYDVYFGTDNPPITKVRENISVASFNTTALNSWWTYYWKIVAKDNYGTQEGYVWSFWVAGPQIDAVNPNPYSNADTTLILSGSNFGPQVNKITLGAGGSDHGLYFSNNSNSAIYLSGDYAYIAAGDSGLRIINVSNPESPELVGNLYMPGFAAGVYVNGNYAYVADGESGLQIIDVSNPANPSITGNINTPGAGLGVFVSGDYAYIADGYSGLQKININYSESSETLESFVDTPDYANGVYISGNYAYVADRSSLQVIDVINARAVSSIVTSDAQKVYVSAGYAYVAEGYSGLKIVDVRYPDNTDSTKIVGSLGISGYARDVYVSGNYAYVADYWGGLQKINIIDKAHPVITSSNGWYSDGVCVNVNGNYVYSVDEGYALRIFDTTINNVGNIDFNFGNSSDNTQDVYVKGNYAYVANGMAGLKILNISNPLSPFIIGRIYIQNGADAKKVFVYGNYAYVLYETGLQIIDVSYPEYPVIKGSIDTSGDALGIFVSGNYAYIADGSEVLQIIDVSNPESPSFAGNYYNPEYANGVYVDGIYAYVINGYSQLQIIDVRYPDEPIGVSSIYTDDPQGVFVRDGYAFVANGYSGLQIFDVSNPSEGVYLINSIGTSDYAKGVFVNGNNAYILEGNSGLEIIDISNPENISITGSVNTLDNAQGIFVSGGYAYIANGGSGLMIIDKLAKDIIITDNITLDSETQITVKNIPKGIVPGTYYVLEDNSDGSSGGYNYISIFGAPTNVSAAADGNNITITWNSVVGATLYKIYDSNGNLIFETRDTYYTYTEFGYGTYRYTVIAVDEYNNLVSISSNEASVNIGSLPAGFPAGLISYYNFDEGNYDTTYDFTGRNNGIKTEGATWVNEGKSGSALNFNGSSYVDITSNGFPEGNKDRTIEAWVKTNTIYNYGEIMSYGTDQGGQAMTFGVYNGSAFASSWSSPQYTTNNFSLKDGNWHHVAFTVKLNTDKTYDTAKIYIDGVLRDTREFTPNTVLAQAKIGSRLDGSAEYWSGLIDEVAIYNRALTPDEIWQRGGTLVAYYPFNGDANDIVGGNNGTLQSGASFYEVGFAGQALSLNGYADLVTAPHASSLNFGTNDFTIELQVNFRSTEFEQVLIEKYDILDQKGWSLTKTSNNHIIFVGPGTDPNSNILDVTPPEIPIDTWMHVKVTRVNDKFTIYWNEAAFGFASVRVDLDSNSLLKIGNNENWSYLNGLIDELKIYNTFNSFSGITAIAAGWGHSLAIKNDSTVWAWGYNGSGQLGDGTTNDRDIPAQVNSLSGVIAIAGGEDHSLALKNDSTVWAWGYNNDGQLGDGTTNDSYIPVQVRDLAGITAIAAGAEHSVTLKNDSTVWTWGYNSYGQLGDGTTNYYSVIPVQVSGLTGITAIAGGGWHTVALKNDGTIWTWGYNNSGQLGDGTTNNSVIPVQVSDLAGITAIAGGWYHTIALKNNGTVWTWGANSEGQLGDGTTNNSVIPVQVSGLIDVTAIAGGENHSIALRNDGKIWTWGKNYYGQLGNKINTNSFIPVQVSGVPTTVISNFPPTNVSAYPVSEQVTVSWTIIPGAISYNVYFAEYNDAVPLDKSNEKLTIYVPYCVISNLSNGTRYAFAVTAVNSKGEESELSETVTATPNNPPVLYSIGSQSVDEGQLLEFTVNASDSDENILTYSASNLPSNANFNSETRTFSWTPDYTQASTYYNVRFEVSDGYASVFEEIAITVNNINRAPNQPASPSPADGQNYISLSPTLSWTCDDPDVDDTLKYDIYFDMYPEPTTLVNENLSIASLNITNLNRETTYYWKIVAKDNQTQAQGDVWSFTTEKGITAIACGQLHTIAVKNSNTVLAWGYNYYGQLGDSTNINSKSPVRVKNLDDVTAIAGGWAHSIALRNDSTVWAWGWNISGQLGDSTNTDKNLPVQVKNLNNVTAIAAGTYHTIALDKDSTVYAWGENGYGQLGDGTQIAKNGPVLVSGLINNVTAIAAGQYHTIALKNNGTVWAWGYNGGTGQLGDGFFGYNFRITPAQVINLDNVTAIACGLYHSIALKNDNTVWSWGWNAYGQLGDGTVMNKSSPVLVNGLDNVIAIACGGTHTIALKSDGTVWTWGENSRGQLGDGTIIQKTSPVQIFTDKNGLDFNNVIAISGGAYHTVALKDDGTIWVWGDYSNGALGLGFGVTTNQLSPIQLIIQ